MEESEPTKQIGKKFFRWLKNDLEAFVKPLDNRPVVVIHHYGCDDFSRNPKWWMWTEDNRVALANCLSEYNVIAFFSGHKHEQMIIPQGSVNPDGRLKGVQPFADNYVSSTGGMDQDTGQQHKGGF